MSLDVLVPVASSRRRRRRSRYRLRRLAPLWLLLLLAFAAGVWAGAHRSPSVPDIPTVAEAALPGFEAETWWGIVAPAGTSHAVLAKLNAAARQALASDDTKKRFADLGMSNGGSSPEELDAYIKSEIAKWSKVIKDANIQPMD